MAKKHFAVSLIPILIFSLIGVGFLFWQLKQAKEATAGTNDNVSGWAWSENIGWISFNNITGGGGTSYGVHICSAGDPNPLCSGKSEGDFVGYAWSENIGWIDFAPPGPYPAAPNYSAKVNIQTKEVSGWARAIAGGTSGSGGWDGWIKLRGSNYGVWIDNSTKPAQFRGFAWGSDVIGWILFNCKDSQNPNICNDTKTSGTGTPLDEGFKVYTTFAFNQAPTVSNFQDPDLAENYCQIASGLGQVSFQWQYNDVDGDSELKFDFRVNNVNNVNAPNPAIDKTINNPPCLDSNPGPAISCTNSQYVTIGAELNYNSTYYWWVRVYDDKGNNSGWVAGPSFQTASHPWPWPEFTIQPENPIAEELITFIDNSKCYDPGQYDCRDKNNTYFWTFGDGQTSNERGNTTHSYQEEGTYIVRLRITDYENPSYSCEISKTIDISAPLPEWEEIPPY